MKGLLLKDFYVAVKHCRAYVLMALLFLAISFTDSENMFFVFYPCMLCGMIPVTLLSYDERSHWLQYCGTLPYTKAQIVSAKFLIGLMTQLAVLVLTGVVQALRMIRDGGFSLAEFAPMMVLVLLMSVLATSISMPFMFRFGVEKGRVAYYVMVGAVCAGGALGSVLLQEAAHTSVSMPVLLPVLCLVSVGLYALSWYLSIVFYQKREVV